MYSCVLTELGIAIFANQKCVKAFRFENPAVDYVSVKKGQSKLNMVEKFLTDDKRIVVNDH
jgi:nucleolar protein 56